MEAHAVLGDEMMADGFDSWMLERDRRIEHGARLVQAPFARKVIEAFDGWRNAVALVLNPDHDCVGGRSFQYPREDCVTGFLACSERLRCVPTQFAYDAWRRERLREVPAVRVPSSQAHEPGVDAAGLAQSQ
jgi:hypothetical protein